MAKTHPHIEAPTVDQLRQVIEGRPENIVATYLALHEVVRTVLPDVHFSVDTVDAEIGYGAHQYGYNGWGLAALTPFGTWVSLTLLQGSQLDDPAGLLTGTAVMRHIKLSKPDAVAEQREPIAALLRAAAQLYEADGRS